jgi:hypothetical protein
MTSSAEGRDSMLSGLQRAFLNLSTQRNEYRIHENHPDHR